MYKKQFRIKADTICWHQFTRHADAAFLSLSREIRIGVLSVATLLTATPDSAAAKVAMAPVSTDDMSELCTEGALDDIPPIDVLLQEEVDTIGFTERTIELSCTNITASRVPIPEDKATRIVQVINTQDIEASAAQSVSDLLKLVAGVDVRQRGGYGIQTDIGVNGGNEDQLAVMLNGVNISNPHTGHLTMDLPVSMTDIERIEIIEGGAGRIYGSSAFAGVINIVTKSEAKSQTGINLTGGSYGTIEANGHINYLSGNFRNRISGGWAQSDGATNNSDFKKGNVYWNEQYTSEPLDIRLQAGFSTKKYGANTFYGTGSQSQYEENSHYLLSIQGETHGRLHLMPQVYWNRTYDHYIWKKENPAAYENYHQTNVYGANINTWTQWKFGRTSVGVEFRREEILSTRLGKPIDPNHINSYPGYKYKDGRTNTGIYLEHDIWLKHWSFSAGLLMNKNTSVEGGLKLYPGIDVSYSPQQGMRFYASFNQSLRTPTYTDLYYNGPGLEANGALKPEKSTDLSVGWSYTTPLLSASLKGFYRHETDMIDWVKLQGATSWTSANSDIDNFGAEALLTFDFTKTHLDTWLQHVSVGYCYNYQKRRNEEQAANYASQLVYLRHKFVATIRHLLIRNLSAQWEFVYKDRTGWFDHAQTGARQNYGSFGQLDLRLQWAYNNYKVYAQVNNLTGKHYYDIANVPQPGCWFTVGGTITIDL